MIPEIALLKLLMVFDLYNKYYKYININKYNYKELALVYQTLPRFFEKYPRDTNLDEFSVFFFGYYPRLKPEEVDAYRLIFEQSEKAVVAPEVAADLLEDAARRQRATEMAEAAISYTEGRLSTEAYQDALKKSSDLSEVVHLTQPDSFITDNLEELKHELVTKPGLRWRLPSLNHALGSLRKGDFGFVFARPETGKTTFLASEITHFAGQTEQPILWFNNEEQGNKVKLRCFQAALGVTLEQLFSNTKKSQEKYNQLIRGPIKIYDDAAIFKNDVERICDEQKPALIIFDQIDKVKGFAADRNDLMMGAIYQWARELAKRYAPVIGICQADGSAEYVKWLSMAHVADAKTAKQAEADWMLGIGRSQVEGVENVRHFHVSKNKLTGDEDSKPEMRHGKWDVWIEPEIARYSDMGS